MECIIDFQIKNSLETGIIDGIIILTDREIGISVIEEERVVGFHDHSFSVQILKIIWQELIWVE